MKKKYISFLAAGLLTLTAASNASAGFLTGGDAADQASADVILDIAFAIDTSASMNDEISFLTTNIGRIVQNLDCPDCDVWVRASFMGITSTSGSLFNQTVRNYVLGLGETPVSNHIEDNGPAVQDLANWYNWNDDSTAGQRYYKAIVTIGDEGTQDGYPVVENDWQAALAANQAAIANDIMVFSLIGTVYPSSGYIADQPNRDAVFTALAEGGSKTFGANTYTLGDTGGLAIFTTSNTLEADIEEIICFAAGGGGNVVPEPATMLLFGTGLTGLVAARRRKKA